ncbi:MAG: UDP-N-acetylmuramoyl-tripeptide--D-alanyl-D-alanine ligase [Ignavibacteria bacterium]|nr:UDP-N-acetylmuramoyl-tripeptide--D-alanyl-D-alanine ligase [Ignavibacteria bacterium]
MKQIKITLKDLFNLPTASIYNPDGYKSAVHVTIDSRNIKPNSIFIAIKGEKFNGHDFVKEALAKGANAVIIDERELKKFARPDGTIVTVENTVQALGDLAYAWRKKLSAKVIGITGSNGKTTTKEILSVLLAERYKVQATVRNNNNHIGVPLTILSCNGRHQILIAETGTNHFGEIAYTSKILQPDFALITNIGASHLEYLKNLQGVKKEKISLFDETEKNKGLVFINVDDPRLQTLTSKYKNISFGFTKEADIQTSIKGYTGEGKTILRIQNKKTTLEFTSPLLGEHNAKNITAAIIIALKMGLTKKEILSGITKIKPVKQRLETKIYKNVLLIDDTYNANPQSMKAAFEAIKMISLYPKKIAILGDMFELGAESKKEHELLAASIKKNKIDEVYLVGKRMKHLAIKLREGKIICKHFATREKLGIFLANYSIQNSVVLVKGSRGMKMEEFVNQTEKRLQN